MEQDRFLKFIEEVELIGFNSSLDNMLYSICQELSDEAQEELKDICNRKDTDTLKPFYRNKLIKTSKFRIIVKNVAGISDCDIEVNNLTTISGYNNSGKSRLMKIIYCALRVVSRSEEILYYNKINNREELLLNDYFKDYLTRCLGSDLSLHRNSLVEFYFNGNLIMSSDLKSTKVHNRNSTYLDVIYISDPNILTYLNYMNDSNTVPLYDWELRARLFADIQFPSLYCGRTGLQENYTGVIIEDNIIKLKNPGYNSIIPSNMGSGCNLDYLLETLVSRDLINENTLVMIDCPENSLHGKSIKPICNSLINLQSPLLIATHSADFINILGDSGNIPYIVKRFNTTSHVEESDARNVVEHLIKDIFEELST